MTNERASNANANLRKIFASKGDDATLTRFVKMKPPHQPDMIGGLRQVRGNQGTGYGAAAVQEGRSIFSKAVKDPRATNTLVSAHCNAKIGRDVRLPSDQFDGYWIFTVSLEERKTCPSTCQHWTDCYGNNMPYAKRLSHQDDLTLMLRLRQDVEVELAKMHSGRGKIRKGVLVRLHVLGDFFSEDYVVFWRMMLRQHPDLAVYGYTARDPLHDPIGAEIARTKVEFGPRFAIRWSDGGFAHECTVSIPTRESKPDNAFQCPEQVMIHKKRINPRTGKPFPMLCATCGLCWSTSKNVAFVDH